jgi:hypothetical protein
MFDPFGRSDERIISVPLSSLLRGQSAYFFLNGAGLPEGQSLGPTATLCSSLAAGLGGAPGWPWPTHRPRGVRRPCLLDAHGGGPAGHAAVARGRRVALVRRHTGFSVVGMFSSGCSRGGAAVVLVPPGRGALPAARCTPG